MMAGNASPHLLAAESLVILTWLRLVSHHRCACSGYMFPAPLPLGRRPGTVLLGYTVHGPPVHHNKPGIHAFVTSSWQQGLYAGHKLKAAGIIVGHARILSCRKPVPQECCRSCSSSGPQCNLFLEVLALAGVDNPFLCLWLPATPSHCSWPRAACGTHCPNGVSN